MKEKIVKYLEEVLGLDESDSVEAYESYIETIKNEITSMYEAIAIPDLEKLYRNAHSIKGCSLNCGDIPTSEIAIAMQKFAKENDLKAYEENLLKLKEIFDAV